MRLRTAEPGAGAKTRLTGMTYDLVLVLGATAAGPTDVDFEPTLCV